MAEMMNMRAEESAADELTVRESSADALTAGELTTDESSADELTADGSTADKLSRMNRPPAYQPCLHQVRICPCPPRFGSLFGTRFFIGFITDFLTNFLYEGLAQVPLKRNLLMKDFLRKSIYLEKMLYKGNHLSQPASQPLPSTEVLRKQNW